ncbi:MAG TPA: hypothetical protein VFV44_11040 [Nitrospiraceae bacterium]|nr:hypothetical protein [Nitrospiraceae bacterium]
MAVQKQMLMPIWEWCKKPNIIAAVIVAGFVSGTFVPHLVSGSGPDAPTCGRFDYSRQCDLSPTLALILDLVVGGLLALFLFYLSKRNQIRLDQIIASQEALRHRRMDYAAQHLKQLFQLTLFTMSVTKRSISHYNLTVGLADDEKPMWMKAVTLSELRRDEAKLGRVLQSVRNILTAANDVLDPDIVTRVEGVCNYLGEISVEQQADGTMEFPKYEVCRIKVQFLIEMLQTYSRETRSFKDIVEEPSRTSTIDSEPELAEEVKH